MASGEVIDIDALDTRLTDDGIEWYCEWTKGGDPNRRILVNGNTPLDQFLTTQDRCPLHSHARIR